MNKGATKKTKVSWSFRATTAVVVLLLFCLLSVKAYKVLDPDFGYRLTTGQMILDSGFPRTDPYTYTMPSFPYVEHAWIIAVSWAKLFPLVGMPGLSVLASIVALLALFLSAKRYTPWIRFSEHIPFKMNLGIFSNFLFLLSISIIYLFLGVRAQVFGWLIFALFLNLLLMEKYWKKYRVVIPLYFLFWANFHGSFVMGLFVLVTVFVIRAIKAELDKMDVALLVCSFLVTLVNPYGTGMWREAWSSISDASLRLRIAEWHPSVTMFDLPTMIYLAFSVVFVIKQRLKLSLVELVLYFVFLFAALSSRRNLPLWIIVTLPIVTKAVDGFYSDVKRIKFGQKRFGLLYKYVWSFVLFVVAFQIINGTYKMYTKGEKFYPYQAVEVVRQKLEVGNIFSTYGWGGYLIWKMPEQKVFIDGRMPSWRWSDNPEGELSDAFDTFIRMTSGEKSELDDYEFLYQEMFDKYDVELILWQISRQPSKLQEFERGVINTIAAFFGSEESEEPFVFVESLEENGWTQTYSDDTAIILERS